MRLGPLSLVVFISFASIAAADSSPSMDSISEGMLSSSAQSQIRKSVQECWDVASLPHRSNGHVIAIQFNLSIAGQVGSRTTIVAVTSLSEEVIDDLFRAACEAILCAQDVRGFNLPIEHYEKWKTLELEFDPALTPVNAPVHPDREMELMTYIQERECGKFPGS